MEDAASDLGQGPATDLAQGSVTPQALAAADSQYQPFPSYVQWSSGITVDNETWERYRAIVSNRRESSSAETFDRAVRIVTRSAAIDTGALEGLYAVDRGFTYSVAAESAAWQVELAEKGLDVAALFAAQLRAYDLILDMATRSVPVTEMFIRQLHEVLTEPQETYRVLTASGWQEQAIPRGEYKNQPNHPWRDGQLAHAYSPVLSTAPEMQRLVAELGSDAFEAAHPAYQAAYAHYAFVSIHPFADGNGRVARALASIYLYRSDSMPLMIYAEQRAAYLDALEAADAGRHQRFVDFIVDRGVSALARIADLMRLSVAPPAAESLARLGGFVRAVGGLTYEELDGAASRLMAVLQATIASELKSLSLPTNLTASATSGGGMRDPVPGGYRRPILTSPQPQGFVLASAAPADARVSAKYEVYVAASEQTRLTFVIHQDGAANDIELLTSDVHPDVTEDAKYRLGLFVRASVSERLAHLGTRAEAKLRERGLLG